MLSEMANIASECLARPRSTSIWSPRLSKYVCEHGEDGGEVLAERSGHSPTGQATISPTFKWVFGWSLAGTVFFVVLRIVLSLAAGRQPPPLFEKLVLATFDLAKIGFGAIVGLLGGKAEQARSARSSMA